jgi:multidrug efflux pump subunit AcrB
LTFLFDQSLFVRAAVDGVMMEAAIAACLTALMILLFLGSRRSTLIVATSIPLSILCSVVVRHVASPGQLEESFTARARATMAMCTRGSK